MLRIWKSNYVVRRFSHGKNAEGYVTNPYVDKLVFMDVQPAGSNSVNREEGRRTSTRITTISDFIMRTADARNGTSADWLYFDGDWYQCESSQVYRHTPLRHCTATFVKVTESVDKRSLRPPFSHYEKEQEWETGNELG